MDDTQANSQETVEVLRPAPHQNSLVRWQPVVGPETLALLNHLFSTANESSNRVRDESHHILSMCVPPHSTPDHTTGLVVGNIQSGKTMSFTAVTALARDNAYRMIIIITGTSVPLFDQSRRRLEEDLRLNSRADRKWQHFSNPRPDTFGTISATLRDWSDPSVTESERQVILITVMKNHRHLSNLIQLLSLLHMAATPTIVIDDEADQAGLNTRVNQGDESTTYRNLLGLRQVLPHHTFLQYTATPQAPLLINLIDVLSPEFVEVLRPGDNYTGGRDFFLDNDELRLIRMIPAQDIPSPQNPITEPPQSLLEAMQLFFLGVRAGMLIDGGSGNRSMLVHPSQKTLRHAEYYTWVRNVKDQWEQILELPETDQDRRDLLEEFRVAHSDLAISIAEFPGFDQLVPGLARAIRRTEITEVNATRGHTPIINWQSSYAHILVGGQAMDREFTVEGLTITYMPRGVGVGNADTIQQRARFFGYKRPYLGYCRIFLEQIAEQAYRSYVEHEDDIRRQLIAHRDSGRPLSEWKRAFFLSTNLRPTRRNVLDLDYMQGQYRDEWFSPSRPHDSEDAVHSNRALIDSFAQKLPLRPDAGNPERTPTQHHLTATTSLEQAYGDLLAQLRVTDPNDSQKFIGALLQLRDYTERAPEAPCQVYIISPQERRTRTLNDADGIPNLFQGEYPVEPVSRRGSVYPGDRKVRATEGVTVQIHRVDLNKPDNQVVADVPVIAVWLPAESAKGWLVQNQT